MLDLILISFQQLAFMPLRKQIYNPLVSILSILDRTFTAKGYTSGNFNRFLTSSPASLHSFLILNAHSCRNFVEAKPHGPWFLLQIHGSWSHGTHQIGKFGKSSTKISSVPWPVPGPWICDSRWPGFIPWLEVAIRPSSVVSSRMVTSQQGRPEFAELPGFHLFGTLCSCCWDWLIDVNCNFGGWPEHNHWEKSWSRNRDLA